MTSDEIYKLIEANGLTLHGDIEHFAALVASAEREKLEGQIQTLHAMYELASKPWAGLTDEEIEDVWANCSVDWDDTINVLTLARAIEAKLKEKNT